MSNPNPTIRAEMARAGVTQTDLAAALGITQPAVSSRLKGRIDWRLRELHTVADALGIPVAVLVAEPEQATA